MSSPQEKIEKEFDQPLMNEVVHHVQRIMAIIELFEPQRANEKAFTKLEESMMWMQVLIANVPRKILGAAGAETAL